MRQKIPKNNLTRRTVGPVRPQDDFYHFVNGAWIARTSIPKEESRWGSFNEVRKKTDRELKTLVETISKKAHRAGSPEWLVANAYRSYMHTVRRNQQGLLPLRHLLRSIHSLRSLGGLPGILAQLHILGVGALFSCGVDQDLKDSSSYTLYFGQGGLGLPDRDYYLAGTSAEKKIRAAYLRHIEAIFRLSGKGKESAALARAVLDIETRLARISMRKEDVRDVHKTYHPMTVSKLSQEAPAFSWKEYLALLGASRIRRCVVSQPAFMRGVSKLLSRIPLASWKAYLEYFLIDEFAPLLSEDFVREDFSLYRKTLTGAKAMRPLWRRGLSVVEGMVGEALGALYVREYFPPSAKQAMERMVDDLFLAYATRIRALSWMGKSTKRKALAKLKKMGRKIGYPSAHERYRGLHLRPDDLVGNAIRAATFAHRKEMRRLGTNVDRSRWFMTPQTVNAYCSFTLNEIVFPAAILQPPFFDVSGSEALNYGAIGSVIGHEMTHGFDDQGAKFDGFGNMKEWWSSADRARYRAKGKALEKQFNAYEVLPGLSANGALTLGENIADLGGLVIAHDAYVRRLKEGRTSEQNIPSSLRKFFIGFATIEREKSRKEYIRMQTMSDSHSVGRLRVNGPLSNFEPFYRAWGVQKGDALYRPLHARISIW